MSYVRLGLLLVLVAAGTARPAEPLRRFLYVAQPGVRNYVEYGGVGVLVYDMDDSYRFVRRIPTFADQPGAAPENVKGIAASARSARLYVSTVKRLACIDLNTDRMLWQREYAGGCDRMAISPDGSVLYVPSLEGPFWNVVDGATGNVAARVEPNSGAHNTIYGPSGKYAYLAGLKSPYLFVAETAGHTIARKVGPFSQVIRPFTITRDERTCFVNINDLLGFEVGNLVTGKKLARVEVAGYKPGPTKRHGCPSHGIGLRPDGKELWLTDAFNERLHIFDATSMPPKQIGEVKLRDQPGWITFSIDGRHAWPSTGEVVDVATRKVIRGLSDETGRQMQSEKVLEVDFRGGRPVRAGDQFALGQSLAR